MDCGVRITLRQQPAKRRQMGDTEHRMGSVEQRGCPQMQALDRIKPKMLV